MLTKTMRDMIITWHERGYSAKEIAALLKRPEPLVKAVVDAHHNTVEGARELMDRHNPLTHVEFSHKERQ